MKNKNNLICIICIFIVALFTMLPMFFSDYKSSHDTKFHLASIESTTESIKENIIPSRIINISPFGYGTRLFYPPLTHTFTAYTNALINNPITSIEIFHFIVLIASGITMYFLSLKVSKSPEIALVSSVIYMLFPYHISNIYIRDAQSETLLFVFLPLILNGLYELYENNNIKSFYILFITGYVGGMLSHLTMMVYFTFITLILMLIRFKDTIKKIKPLIISSLFILAITSFFTVPLVEQKLLGSYRVFQNGVMVQGTQGNGLRLKDYVDYIGNLKSNNTKYFIDIVTLILLVISLINYKKLTNKFTKCIFYFGIISFVLTTKFFPWDILPKSFRIMQFPWRFETFLALSISLISPLCMNFIKDKKTSALIICILIILFIQPTLNQATSEVININNKEYYYGYGSQEEYFSLKAYANKEYHDTRDKDIKIVSGSSNITINEDKLPKLLFTSDGQATVEFPRLYYVGYTLKDENGKNINVYENDNGFIEASISSGNYILDYTGTKLDNISKIVSVFGLLGGCILVWRKR